MKVMEALLSCEESDLLDANLGSHPPCEQKRYQFVYL